MVGQHEPGAGQPVVQELAVAVEQGPAQPDARKHEGDESDPRIAVNERGGEGRAERSDEDPGEQKARERNTRGDAASAGDHQPDLPGFHCQRLSAAQPAPEKVGSEYRSQVKLQRGPLPARDYSAAGDKLEKPGGDEGDREQQGPLIQHAEDPARDARDAAGCGFPHRSFSSPMPG